MIQIRPYDNFGAIAVLRHLDHRDLEEATVFAGRQLDHLDLFHDWRRAQDVALTSHVLATKGGTPFAVLAVVATDQAGVGRAGFLARDHRRYRRELVQAVREIRVGLPEWAASRNINRIECRCWAGHPTAASFLTLCGFEQEAICPGFGPVGEYTLYQFAWTNQRSIEHVQIRQKD